MPAPNFFLIGAAKSGTSSLHSYLGQHPQVFMSSVKEPHYFAYRANKTMIGDVYADQDAADRFYRSLFDGVRDETAVGEGSTSNMYVPGAAHQIHAYDPAAKIIAVLRHPVERAHSHFMHFLGAGAETTADFEVALAEEAKRLAEGWPPTYGYQQWGFYYRQLKPYFDLFPADQIQIHLYDDYVADPRSVVQQTFAFLAVEPFVPDLGERLNVAPTPSDRVLFDAAVDSRRYVRGAARRIPLVRGRRVVEHAVAERTRRSLELTPQTRARLVETFRTDIEQLQTLIGRDLSGWLVT